MGCGAKNGSRVNRKNNPILVHHINTGLFRHAKKRWAHNDGSAVISKFSL